MKQIVEIEIFLLALYSFIILFKKYIECSLVSDVVL